MPTRAVIVHGIDDCRAALAVANDLGLPVTLRSAPGAAANLGAPVFAAMIERARSEFPGVDVHGVLDCGGDPGYALAAIRHRVQGVRLDASPEVRARVADIAAQSGVMLDDDPSPALDLAGHADVLSACRKWLSMTET